MLRKSVLLMVLIAGLLAGATAMAKSDTVPPPPEKPLPAPDVIEAPPVAPPVISSGPAPGAADAMPSDIASTSYFPVLPFDAPQDAEPQLVPVASNHSIEGDHAGITAAVIVIHDFSRDAQSTLAMLSGLAGTNNATTIIIAPQFLLDFDISRFASRLPERGRMFARWPLGGWENGGNSIAPAAGKPVSSFTVIDLLLMYLSDKTFFPDLRQIAIAGHGTGGDFVQRYAASGRAPGVIGAEGPQIRFLVADAASFLYLTELRPKASKPGFATPDAGSCPGLNAYPYGLDRLNDYVQRVGATSIKLGYAAKPVTYLIGEKAAVSDPLPDEACAAVMQGANRITRAANYVTYLAQVFGDDAEKNHKLVMVPKAGYDAAALFGSPCGMTVLFGDGVCTAEPATGLAK